MTATAGRPFAGFTLLELMIVSVILSIGAAVLVLMGTRSRIIGCHSNPGAALKQLATHEAVWRTQDTDRNGVADFWTRDVAAFHGLHDRKGQPIAFICLSFARADAAPGACYAALGGVSTPKPGPGLGYYLQAMVLDQDGRPYLQPGLPPPAAPNAPAGVCTHATRFGFTAFPAAYGPDAKLIYVVNEDGVVWQKDQGWAGPVLHRGAAAPPGADATWTQFGG